VVEPTREEVASWVSLAVTSATSAAELIRGNLGSAVGVGLKSSPTDIVTQTDVDAESLIRDRLRAATPDAGFVGEEGGQTSPASSLQWIIDPLDGTVNFTYAIPIFAVSIAAAFNGSIVAGAVIDVLRGEVFSAGRQTGAWCNGVAISVSNCDDVAQALVATGFSYRAELRRQHGEVVRHLLPIVRDIRCFGSAALQLCWVACGRIDGYFERDIKLWDYAAGSLIAAEAGARLELPCPENEDLIVCTTDGVFDGVRAAVEQASV
jgi:myo-inositol-1(or 4)-monophosphatase